MKPGFKRRATTPSTSAMAAGERILLQAFSLRS